MFRVFVWFYAVIAVGMIVTSTITTRRATKMLGTPHYLATTTQEFFEEAVPPKNATEAALDSLADPDEPNLTNVLKPLFILGFADATGPFVILGGFGLSAAWLWRRRRNRRKTALATPTPLR